MQKWLSKLNTFARLPLHSKCLFAEALITSAKIKMCLCFFMFKHVLRWMGTADTESKYSPEETSLEPRKQIRAALQLCRRYTLWSTECYTLILTGKLLLSRRHVSSTV